MATTRLSWLAPGLAIVLLLSAATAGLSQKPARKPATTLPPRGPAAGAPSAPRCVFEPSAIVAQKVTSVSQVSTGLKAPPPTPRPTMTDGARTPDASMNVRPAPLGADLSAQLCESLKTGSITTDEVTAMLKTMEKEHANKSHKKRKTISGPLGSYTYEYTWEVKGMKFYQKPGVGYCSDFDWRLMVKNISIVEIPFSTTGEVGVCFSPGFGLFYIPGLASVMPFPIPGLCFDDAAITKLDLRNINNKFEGGFVELVNLAFEKLRKYDAKLCVIGSPTPPWFMLVIIPKKQMVVYCTSTSVTRDCEYDAAKLLAAAKKIANEN